MLCLEQYETEAIESRSTKSGPTAPRFPRRLLFNYFPAIIEIGHTITLRAEAAV
jgi:hypothetical protein